ncbi:UDP-N-acetylglucosamine 2-epimerase (non-hydrolyzing), partial [Cyclobacteriaceae bacterium]|nr:UDP-N-acetylglucosamine 2-epimerase (non-hydrolyzing) [Cyclobacteriaceae bacterium]
QLTGRLADYHFAPTVKSQENLLKENISKDSILVTGNTVIDALLESVELVETIEDQEIEQLKSIVDTESELILVTGHRRENHGEGFLAICRALKQLAETNKEVTIVYPVHLNPNVQKPVFDILSAIENIKLIAPLAYPAFVWLMNQSKLIITDSGGIQEEAPSLGKPVLVMRDTTERPEAVDAGTVVLVGTDEEKIINEANDLLHHDDRYKKMSALHNPYGDGQACERIVNFLEKL